MKRAAKLAIYEDPTRARLALEILPYAGGPPRWVPVPRVEVRRYPEETGIESLEFVGDVRGGEGGCPPGRTRAAAVFLDRVVGRPVHDVSFKSTLGEKDTLRFTVRLIIEHKRAR